MIFKEQKSILENNILNELSILEPNDNYFNPKNIIIIESRNGNCLINFYDVWNISNYNDLSIQETIDQISYFHPDLINPTFLINELMYYWNENYRNAIVENAPYYQMQFYDLDYKSFFDNLLENVIETDLQNNNTYYLDMFLQEGLGDFFSNTLGSGSDLIYNITNQAEKVGNSVSNFFQKSTSEKMNQVWNWGMNKLDDHPELKEKANNFVKNTSTGAAKELFDTAKNSFKNTIDQGMSTLLKNQNLGTMLGSAIGAGGAVLAHAPEGAANTVVEKLSNAKNTVMEKINNLLGKQKEAPPEQQGLISRMIAKLRSVLASITSKLTGAQNQAAKK